jgi:hypothetical protein
MISVLTWKHSIVVCTLFQSAVPLVLYTLTITFFNLLQRIFAPILNSFSFSFSPHSFFTVSSPPLLPFLFFSIPFILTQVAYSFVELVNRKNKSSGSRRDSHTPGIQTPHTQSHTHTKLSTARTPGHGGQEYSKKQKTQHI